ncbi:MAG: hypothetical protein RLZZ589_1003 [Cyanobacteriota bacterium]|jgi:hypothetical protein
MAEPIGPLVSRTDAGDVQVAPPSPSADASGEGGRAAAMPGRSAGQRLKGWIDTLLVIDVFVVIAGAVWFGVAVLCHSRGLEAPLSLFQRLWEPVFTPAIGLLMGAALLSGVLGWCLRWWQRRGPR